MGRPSEMGRLTRWACRAFSLDTRSLAAFRMAIGAIVCADALLRTRDFSIMFAPDGMFPIAVLRAFQADPCVWSLAFCVDAAWWSGVVLALEGLAGGLMAVGACTRLATPLAWVAVVSVIRRTAPATNAGDLWLACLLFWGMFLPLGATWSVDAWLAGRSRGSPGENPPARAWSVCSIASVALVLQIAAVYLSAGIAKCNDTWLSGTALSHALSLHDHGSSLGQLMAWDRWPGWLARPATWSVLALELAGPCLILAASRPLVRLSIAILFIVFHASIAVLMSVGLFGFIGMAAWLAILPATAWPARIVSAPPAWRQRAASGFRWWERFGHACCAVAGCLALVSLAHEVGPWRTRPLPRPLVSAMNLCCLPQAWAMFGQVPSQEQWVYARGDLADGSVVDLLRDGRPLETVRPSGGFASLSNHRWHKMFWELPRPPQRIFSPSIAAAIASRWNATHGPDKQVNSLEIRYARLGTTSANDTLHELLLATWPPRDEAGRGNLDRFLDTPSPRGRAADRPPRHDSPPMAAAAGDAAAAEASGLGYGKPPRAKVK